MNKHTARGGCPVWDVQWVEATVDHFWGVGAGHLSYLCHISGVLYLIIRL